MDIVDKLFNLSYLGKSHISLSKAVLLFYLIVANNHTKDLFSGQLTEFIKNNRYAQHFIGYITMLIIVNSAAGVTDTQKAIIYSAVAYLWFIFTTKLDLRWSLLIIGAMVFGVIYESTMVDREIQSEDDQALERFDKEKIKNRHNRLKSVTVIAIILITIIGTLSYFNKKQVQYGGNFDGMKFMFAARN